MLLRHVALRDGLEAGEARLRGEKVVVRIVGAASRDVVADDETPCARGRGRNLKSVSSKMLGTPAQLARAREHPSTAANDSSDCASSAPRLARVVARLRVRRRALPRLRVRRKCFLSPPPVEGLRRPLRVGPRFAPARRRRVRPSARHEVASSSRQSLASGRFVRAGRDLRAAGAARPAEAFARERAEVAREVFGLPSKRAEPETHLGQTLFRRTRERAPRRCLRARTRARERDESFPPVLHKSRAPGGRELAQPPALRAVV